MNDYNWQRIEDLPEDFRVLSSPDMTSLAEIWKEQSSKIRQSQALKQFNERLSRQWAIETGIIEGLYSIDRGITVLLIERGIQSSLIPHGTTNQPAEAVVEILKDQEKTLEGIFDFVSSKRPLSKSYVKELHQALTAHQEHVKAVDQFGHVFDARLIRGDWKQTPNNPTSVENGGIHEYCPPVHVDSEMDRLVSMHLEHDKIGVPPEVEAAWLHHRFTQIHPFQDGNGRVARALAALVLIRAGWLPVVVDRDDRDIYIDALESADHGDLLHLCKLFSRLSKESFLKAFSIASDVLSTNENVQQLIASAVGQLKNKIKTQEKEFESVYGIANALKELAARKIGAIGNELNIKLQEINAEYVARVDESKSDNDYWFWQQVVNVANQMKYFADLRRHHSWIRLKIHEERQTELVISIHPIGKDFLGLLVVSAFL
jgi:Fic family protein